MTAGRVLVVGAGVIGLSTGINIQESMPGVHVTLMADRFHPDTTSDVAAGFWGPFAAGQTPDELLNRWGKATFDFLLELNRISEAGSIGVFPLSGYWMYDKPNVPQPAWSSIAMGFRRLPETERKAMFPEEYQTIFYFTSLMSDPTKFLPYLQNRFKQNGGSIVKRKLEKLHEVYGHYDVVVNCSGFAARTLVDDTTIVPLRGQVLKAAAPWMKHFVIAYNETTYIFPRVNTVVMGGTCQEGNFNRQPTPEDRSSIIKRCCHLVPSMKDAEILEETVDFRPSRQKGVRLELETIRDGQRTQQVVHNYGHGGAGLTLHWGCAQDATQLVAKALKSRTPHSKL